MKLAFVDCIYGLENSHAQYKGLSHMLDFVTKEIIGSLPDTELLLKDSKNLIS